MTHHLSRDRAALIAGLLGPLAVAAILLPWRASWSNTNVALVLVVAVVAVAAIGSRAAGALAAVSAAVWFDFFFTRPYERFTIRGSADITTAVLLLAVGVAVSQLAARARQLRVITITDAGYLAQIRHAASAAKSAEAAETVVGIVKDQLTSVLDLESCRFEYGSLLGHPPRLEPDGSVVTSHGRQDVEHYGFPAGEIELRTFGNGQYYGRFMMLPRPGAKPSLQARLVAVTLADQAGRAFGAAEAGSRA
jgi:K+-sensing histidine kinase KdpD